MKFLNRSRASSGIRVSLKVTRLSSISYLDTFVFQYPYNFLREEDAARDAVQEVFVWLWQHRYSVTIDRVHPYLHQAVRFQALKTLREQKNLVSLNDRLADLTLKVLEGDGLQYKELK